MTGPEAFSILNSYMGQGHPKVSLVFIGIEGGDASNISQRINTLDIQDNNKVEEFFRESLLGDKLYKNPFEWEYLQHEGNIMKGAISPMWRASSKIALGVSDNADTFDWKTKSNWEYYMDNIYGARKEVEQHSQIYILLRRKT